MQHDSPGEICSQDQTSAANYEWDAHHAHLDHPDGCPDIEKNIASEL